MAIHPATKKDPPAPARRAVLHLHERGGTLLTPSACLDLSHLGVVNMLCSARREGVSQVWLTPTGDDFSPLLGALEEGGWLYTPRARGGHVVGLSVRPPEKDAADDKGRSLRPWRAHTADFLDVPEGLTPEETCAYVYARLDALDEHVFGCWGVRLGVSVASTAVDVLRTFLTDTLDLSRTVAVDLRKLDAYGGGRIELYQAGDYTAPEVGYNRGTGEVAFDVDAGPCEWDIASCYGRILRDHPMPGGFLGFLDPKVSARNWCKPCTLTTALVRVHGAYPALRYRAGRVYYPTGQFFGTWTAEELQAPGVEVLAIPDRPPWPGAPHPGVYAFEDRSGEMSRCADSLLRERERAAQLGEAEIADVLKLMVNALVGALASRPRVVTTVSRHAEGARLVAPGAWEVDSFKPSAREVLSTAATVTGIGRAYAARTLARLEAAGAVPLDVHTDGGRALGYGVARAALADSYYKVKPLKRVEVWGPAQSIATAHDGTEVVRAGGLSRSLTPEELRVRARTAQAARDLVAHAESGRARLPGGASRPYAREELDAERRRGQRREEERGSVEA